MVVVKTGSPYTTTATATNAASTAYTYGLNNVAITVNNVDAAANGKATVRGVATTLLDDDGDGDVDTVAYLVKNVFTLTSKPVTKTVNGVDYVKVVGVMDDFVKASMADGYKDLVKGDTVLWFVDCTGTYHFAKAAEVTGTYTGSTTVNGLTSYKIGDKSQPLSQLNVGDSDSTKTYGAPLYTGTEATYYTDDFGYWCGDKAVAVDNTVYVLAAGYSQLTGLQAKVLFAETGKVDTITVASVNGGVSEPDANTVDTFGLKSGGDEQLLVHRTKDRCRQLCPDSCQTPTAPPIMIARIICATTPPASLPTLILLLLLKLSTGPATAIPRCSCSRPTAASWRPWAS
jgi:hypothetical protein